MGDLENSAGTLATSVALVEGRIKRAGLDVYAQLYSDDTSRPTEAVTEVNGGAVSRSIVRINAVEFAFGVTLSVRSVRSPFTTLVGHPV
ncbi:hypothetical protein HT576_21355 [Haloterrigena sp. SYSU A121-1]|uniref:Uncharacterized protein n=1 Tax=Haloterrigena gelatinilytica TaxID=2741724 RepID=A0A8J8KGL3_9EURY|nr:hypothetical protein [Haloterrigena gelatinilytica]NUB93538.1 hypothetical protein [Haloterrigena gelatinilytica]